MGGKMFHWKKEWINMSENGSYTVEAAFVVPIVLGIAFIILYTLFLQHDRVMIQANLGDALFLAAEGDSECMEEYREYFQKSLWCMQVQEAELSNGLLLIKGSAAAEAFWKIPVLSYFITGKEEISLSESYGGVQPEEIIRYGADFMKGEEK